MCAQILDPWTNLKSEEFHVTSYPMSCKNNSICCVKPIKTHQRINLLHQGLRDLFCEKLDSKYFRLWGPSGLFSCSLKSVIDNRFSAFPPLFLLSLTNYLVYLSSVQYCWVTWFLSGKTSFCDHCKHEKNDG